jgi:hypothetical protein
VPVDALAPAWMTRGARPPEPVKPHLRSPECIRISQVKIAVTSEVVEGLWGGSGTTSFVYSPIGNIEAEWGALTTN